jgi:hypothetical protein
MKNEIQINSIGGLRCLPATLSGFVVGFDP